MTVQWCNDREKKNYTRLYEVLVEQDKRLPENVDLGIRFNSDQLVLSVMMAGKILPNSEVSTPKTPEAIEHYVDKWMMTDWSLLG